MKPQEAIEILKKNKPTSDTRECGKELCQAVDVAIEAVEKLTHNCEDCIHADYVPSINAMYCFEHYCVMKTNNYCRDWSEEE